ncbi:hypothetical protein TWF696_005386 [Orbilia brochopaga]|uniref:Uncharacterized protein n=1 Tax=Orbilia brochopaga TaxID=3140254 RepID=A0AAV9V0S3_9PEZI
MPSPGPIAVAVAAGITRGTAACAASPAAFLRPPLVVIHSARWSTTTPTVFTRPPAALQLRPLRPPTSRRGIATSVITVHGSSASTTAPPSPRKQPSVFVSSRVAGSRRYQSTTPSISPSEPSESQPSTFASRFFAPRPARPIPEPLPLPPRGPDEPELKILYSAREDSIRRAPDPSAPKGSFWYYHFKIFSIFPESPEEKTPRTWIIWHSTVFLKIFLFMGFVLVNLGFFAFGCLEVYIETQDPTPPSFSKKVARQVRLVWIYTHLYEDPVLAGVHARQAINRLETQMNEQGGWENCSMEWKRAYVDFAAKVAKMSEQIGNHDDAYVLYERILAIEPEVVDARRRSQASLGMSGCAVQKGNLEQATMLVKQAVQLAVEAMPEDDRLVVDTERPVLPEPGKGVPLPSPELLAAVQAAGVHFARLGKPQVSLPIFLSLLRTLQALPSTRRDVCKEASIMAYLGEVVWALGKKADGLAWTKRAFEDADQEARTREACRGCAEYAVANAITMTREIGPGKGKTEEDVDREVAALKTRQDRLEMIRVGEEWRLVS